MTALLAALAALGPPSGTASDGGASVAWWFSTDALVVFMEAPTDGWVAVGFNDALRLDNSRLAMAAISAGVAVAEEHHARPPEHPRQRLLPVRASEEAHGKTTVLFEIPLAPAVPGTLTLAPGATCGLTLAYSREDDFAHHSVWRGLLEVRL